MARPISADLEEDLNEMDPVPLMHIIVHLRNER